MLFRTTDRCILHFQVEGRELLEQAEMGHTVDKGSRAPPPAKAEKVETCSAQRREGFVETWEQPSMETWEQPSSI